MAEWIEDLRLKMINIGVLPTDTIAQLVRAATHYADVMGSNPRGLILVVVLLHCFFNTVLTKKFLCTSSMYLFPTWFI